MEGRVPTDSGYPWQQFRERYVREHREGAENYNFNSVARRVEEAISPRCLTDVTASSLSLVMAKMREEGLENTTIRGHMQHFMGALSWAKSLGMIKEVPVVRLPKKGKGRGARSRPITGEEFDRLCDTIRKVKRNPEPWIDLVNVLYWGGLRIGEANRLTADCFGDFAILLDHEPPVFSIGKQKNARSQLLPVAPELVEFLQSKETLPKKGRLLRNLPKRTDSLVDALRTIGQKSGIVVNADTGKTVTAHDLRRSFGTRWAQDLLPVDLKELMRHEKIDTTMDYYVEVEIRDLSDKLWNKFREKSCRNQPPAMPKKKAG
jgi:integrase